jgi:hypothetical protein
MNRVNPTPKQKQRLLEANAFRCCVCKRPNIGVNIHHIDGHPSNTVDENLAILCVEDHDEHHRPDEYEAQTKHLELDAEEILRLKDSWEAFVTEARKPDPKVIATLSCYGSEELIHSLQFVLQWSDERIQCKRSFHLLDGDLDKLTDDVFRELASISPAIKIAVINKPLPVERCPCCGVGFSRTIKPAVVARLTDPTWATESSCCIYINPSQPSLALSFFLRNQYLSGASLHLCQGKYLHCHCEGADDRVPIKSKPSVRSQATRIVNHVLREWTPAKVFIGTGNPDAPQIISDLMLPRISEKTER